MPHKIGTYVRVSTEEQAQVVEGSIDSQQHRQKKFVEAKNEVERNWARSLSPISMTVIQPKIPGGRLING